MTAKAKKETKALAPIDDVRNSLTKMTKQFAMALPPQIKPDRFIRVAMTAIQQNSALLDADRQSLFGAIMKCAQDGLIPDGRDAALVCYGKTVQYMPMVGGVCKKARNSGEIKTIGAEVVRENDEYDHWTDETGEHFKHRRASGDRGEVVKTYAYATTKDDGFFFEEIDEEQMDAIRNVSKAKAGPWNGPFADEMRRKSAIRRLAKYRIPSSTDLDAIIRRDDELYDLNKEEREVKPSAKSSRLSQMISDDDKRSASPAEVQATIGDPPPPQGDVGDFEKFK